MQIDWITVGAQIANFLVLVWLLQRFLYVPVVSAMERREQRIRDRLQDAERKKADADNEARLYRERQEELEKKSHQMLAEARREADEERKMLEHEAREEIEDRKREWLGQLQTQRETFIRDLRRRSADQFFELARRALADLGDADLETQIASGIAGQLEQLDADEKAKIISGYRRAGGTVKVRSRFELSSTAKRELTGAFHRLIGEDAKLAYETSDDVSCGIELKSGSQTVSWNLDSYLDGLEKAVGEQLSAVLAASEEQGRE